MSEENNQKNINSSSEEIRKETEVEGKSLPKDLRPLRTYQGDVDHAISRQKISLVNVAMAEQERNRKEPIIEDSNFKQSQNKFFMLVGSLLFILGIITIGAIYYVKNQREEKEIAQKSTILSHVESFSISLATSTTKGNLAQNILSKKRDFKQPVNSILYIDINKNGQTAEVQEVLTILTSYAPKTLIRKFSGDYMIGIYSFDTNEPFILLKTKDYGGTYAGMINWEKDMALDLSELFNVNLIGTSTYSFKDESLKNKDLRVAKSNDGKTVLLYSFLDKNTLLITSTEKIFNAILSKYFNSQMAR